MSSTPGRRMKIGDFLLRRLEEADVRHLRTTLSRQSQTAATRRPTSTTDSAVRNIGRTCSCAQPSTVDPQRFSYNGVARILVHRHAWIDTMVLMAAALVVRDAAHAPRVVPSLYRF